MKKFRYIALIFAVIIIATVLMLRAGRTEQFTAEEFLFDSRCSITVYGPGGEEAVKRAFNSAAEIHYQTNFYDEYSQISSVNKAPAGVSTKVSRDIIEIIKLAKEINKASEGAFDITIAPVSQLWNIGGGRTAPPMSEEIEKAVALVGRDSLVIDEENLTITKEFGQTKIDLGGIAKGYAADIAVSKLKEAGIKAAIIDLGGNIVAFGRNPATKDGKWRIGIQKPFGVTGDYAQTVEIHQGAVVTSGTYQRYFEYEGWILHHLLDPVNGIPVQQNFNSVVVIGESSAICDGLSTAAFVLGEKKGQELVKKYNCEMMVIE